MIVKKEPDRYLYLAIPILAYGEVFEESLGRLIQEDYQIFLVVFNVELEEVLQWIPDLTIANKDKIVLAFYAPEMRGDTGLAIA